MRTALAVTLALAAGAAMTHHARADDMEDAAKLVRDAAKAQQDGKPADAVALARKAVKLDPANARAHFVVGVASLSLRKTDDAVAALREVIRLDPKFAAAYDRLGDALLKSGQFEAAVAAFNKFLELEPKFAPEHWRLGIALYYAGKFEAGKKLFELHRTVNPEDVENSAWHYLCNARATSPKKAREELIPVTKDARVPMKQVLELFAGKLKPADVIEAAEKSGLRDDKLTEARFYAHLYVGLFYEAEGDAKKAAEHIATAVEKYKIGHYMWDVGAAHLLAMKKKDTK